MNPITKKSLSFFILLLSASSFALASNHPGSGGPGGNTTGGEGGDGGDFAGGGGGGNTGDDSAMNCSVVYQMNVGELQSEMGGQDVHLKIKRLKPTPLLFTPQTLFYDSPLASELFDLEADPTETAVSEAQTSLDVASSDLSEAQATLDSAQTTLNDLEAEKETARIAGNYSLSYVPPQVALPEAGDVITIAGISELDTGGNTVNTVATIDTGELQFTVEFDGATNGDPLLVNNPATYTVDSSPNGGHYGNLVVGNSYAADATFVFYGAGGAYNGTLVPSGYSRAYWRWKHAETAYNEAFSDYQSAQQSFNDADAALTSAEAARDAEVQSQQTTGSLLALPDARTCGVIDVLRPNGTGIQYAPKAGKKYWEPQGDRQYYQSRIIPREIGPIQVCARADGMGREFQFEVAAKERPVYKTQAGRRVALDSPGVRQEVIKKSGVMRQVCTPQAVSDIRVIDEHSYEVSLYKPEDMGAKNAEGVYVPNGSAFARFRVENPTRDTNQLNRVQVTSWKGNRQKVREWEYSENAGAWTYKKEGGDIQVDKTITDIGNQEEVYRWEVANRDAANQPKLCGVKTEVVKEFDWGKMATRKVVDPEGANLVQTYDYFTDAAQEGKYGKVKTEVKPDGSWVTLDYDSEGRETVRIEPWLDAAPGTPAAQAKATYYDYTPVDPSDTPLEYDIRPRTKTVKVEGDTIKKTFYAYFHDASGEFVEVEEMAATPTAAYGNAANLRRTKTYYAETEDEDIAGRLKTEAHPDGLLDTYTYERLADNTFITTVTHGVAGSPAGVANKTTREVTTLDPKGNETVKQTYVYTGGTTYELVETVEKDYNERGQITERRRNGRILYSATYVDGLRVSKTDEQGITTTYTHDAHERVATEAKVGVNGQADIVTTYTYDGEDRILKKEVQGGSLRLYEEWAYDLAGRMTSYRDQNGYLTTYLYENDGRKVTRTNPDTGVVVTERFRDGRLKSVSGGGTVDAYYAYTVNADGSITTGKTVGRSDSLRVLSTTKDVLGRVTERRRPGFGGSDFVIGYAYDTEGYLVKQTETEKADTLFVYNTARQLHRRGLDLDANGVLDLASDDRISETDESFYEDTTGDWWRSSKELIYDESGLATPTLAKETRRRIDGFAAGQASQTLIIDTHGNQTNVIATIDRATAGMVVTTSVAESSLDAADTYLNGLLQSRTTATVAEPTVFTYDDLARRKTVKQPRHTQASVFHYRKHVYGQTVIPPESPAVASPHEDEASSNLLASVTDPAGNTTEYLYYDDGEQGAGRVHRTKNASGSFSYNSYDLLGRQERTWGDSTYPVEFAYNEFGEQVGMTTYRTGDAQDLWTDSTWPETPPTGDTTTWAYDEATGLLTAKTDASAESVTYDYTVAGRMSDRYWARLDTQSNPLQTSYGYDPLTGERTLVDYADSTPDITYALDRAGRLETVTDATGSRSFAYRGDLQSQSETIASFYGTDKSITRTYESGTPGTDVVGRYTGFEVGTAADTDADYAVAYGFDAQGRLDAVTDANSMYSYGYLADSNLIETLASPVHSTTYTYEDERNVKTVVDNAVNSISTSKYTYAYDEIGRRTSRVQEGTAFAQDTFDAFDYNDRSEVTGSERYLGTDTADLTSPVAADGFAYEFDPIGNRTTATAGTATPETYTTNELNQYTAISGVSAAPVHDADGNLTQQDGWFYKWNAENRLVEAYSFAADKKLEFVYDYLGRRVEKKVTQISTATVTSEERFLYDGWNLVATYQLQSSNFTLQTSYTWGLDLSQSLQGAGGIGGLLGAEELAGAHQGVYAFTFDVNGNVSEVLDDAGGSAAHYEYSPFGEVTWSSGAYADANTFRFSTKYLDTETGFYYYGYRHYDPATGRWLSKDPLGERGGVNLFAYVLNNPTALFDILGLSSICGDSGGGQGDEPSGSIFGKIWNLPNTALGISWGILGGGFIPWVGAEVSFGHNAIQFENHPFMPSGPSVILPDGTELTAGSGISLGNAISYSGRASDNVLTYDGESIITIGDHEEYHTFQSENDGPLYLPNYFLNGGITGDNTYEIEADNFAIGRRERRSDHRL